MSSFRLLASLPFVIVLAAGCGGGDGTSSGAGGAGGSGEGGGSSSGPSGGGASNVPFADCGGKIYDPKTGKLDPAEYKKQATNWSREAIDCRLGAKFSDLHPNDKDDKRPSAPLVPLIPRNDATYLCPEFDHATPGPAGYGSTSGQVAFAPKDPKAVGLDRIQTSGWEGGGECFQPLQGGWLGGVDPDGVVVGWQMQGLDVGVPIAKGRTEQGETGDGVLVFSSGLVGTDGTQTSGSTHPATMLPPHKIPTAVSVTNYNEFALVTVWDTDALKGQVAVFALRAGQPASFSIHLFGAPNEGGFDAIQLLGFVDLPDDIKTPTAISATGNNTQRDGHPWVDDPSDPMAYQGIGQLFADLDYDAMVGNPKAWIWESDPKNGNGLFGSAGGAVIASAWEDKVVFLDLAPLYAFVRKVYIDPIQNMNDKALYDQATNPATPWPFDFTSNPEMKPKVVATAKIAHPNVVRLGIAPDPNTTGLAADLLGWVGALDGTLAFFDASVLVGKGSAAPIHEVAKIEIDPNPTSIHLTGHNASAFLSSRGNRSVQWLSVADAPSIDGTFRDARVDDPVATDHNQRWGNLLTIGDFSAGKVFNFEQDCDDMGQCTWAYDGALKLPGSVYFVDTANVN